MMTIYCFTLLLYSFISISYSIALENNTVMQKGLYKTNHRQTAKPYTQQRHTYCNKSLIFSNMPNIYLFLYMLYIIEYICGYIKIRYIPTTKHAIIFKFL